MKLSNGCGVWIVALPLLAFLLAGCASWGTSRDLAGLDEKIQIGMSYEEVERILWSRIEEKTNLEFVMGPLSQNYIEGICNEKSIKCVPPNLPSILRYEQKSKHYWPTKDEVLGIERWSIFLNQKEHVVFFFNEKKELVGWYDANHPPVM